MTRRGCPSSLDPVGSFEVLSGWCLKHPVLGIMILDQHLKSSCPTPNNVFILHLKASRSSRCSKSYIYIHIFRLSVFLGFDCRFHSTPVSKALVPLNPPESLPVGSLIHFRQAIGWRALQGQGTKTEKHRWKLSRKHVDSYFHIHIE